MKYKFLSSVAMLLLTSCAPVVPVTPDAPAAASSAQSSSLTITSDVPYPLAEATARITKKPFGIFIVSATSPIQPERFSGYHSGIDFETFPDEQEIEVPVTAICSGTVRERKWVGGYGGVVITDCTINGQAVTILYGHVNIDSVAFKIDQSVKAGDVIGNLGKGFSKETDGERKHLHLSVHKGTAINLRGYVQTEKELSEWLDPYEW